MLLYHIRSCFAQSPQESVIHGKHRIFEPSCAVAHIFSFILFLRFHIIMIIKKAHFADLPEICAGKMKIMHAE
jgi:hypothetical protein